MHNETPTLWIGLAGGAVAVAIWTGWIAATRLAMIDAVDPLVLAICRTGLPAVVLAPLIWRRGLIPRDAGVGAVVLMALGWGAPFVLFVGNGLKTVPAGLFGPLVPGLAPILVAGLAWGLFAERPGRGLRAGLALIGTAFVLVVGQWVLAGDWAALGGAPYLIAASVGISLYTVMFRRSRLSPLEGAAYISLYSLPMLAVWIWLAPGALSGVPVSTWAFHALVQGGLAGIVAVLAYGLAVRHLGAMRGSTANALVPVTAALVGWLALGEHLGPLDWAAAGMASLGVAAANGLGRAGRA